MANYEVSNNENLDTFGIWWLDEEVNNKENWEAQKRLRSFIDYLQTFDNANKFEQRLQSMSYNDRAIIIVSGRLGSEVVPRIHAIGLVSFIYVYCFNKAFHEKWARKYGKVTNKMILSYRYTNSKFNEL